MPRESTAPGCCSSRSSAEPPASSQGASSTRTQSPSPSPFGPGGVKSWEPALAKGEPEMAVYCLRGDGHHRGGNRPQCRGSGLHRRLSTGSRREPGKSRRGGEPASRWREHLRRRRWIPVARPGQVRRELLPGSSGRRGAGDGRDPEGAARQGDGDVSGSPAWRSKPSWYQISSEDRMISPENERRMVGRIGARKVITLAAGHASLASRPVEVAALIDEAAKSNAG